MKFQPEGRAADSAARDAKRCAWLDKIHYLSTVSGGGYIGSWLGAWIHKTSVTFPHENTSDQFFSESQFESYCMLGAYTMQKLCRDCAGDFDCFIRAILEGHFGKRSQERLEAPPV